MKALIPVSPEGVCNEARGAAAYRYIRRYLAKFHPEVMKEIWLEGKTATEINKMSLKLLSKNQNYENL